MDKAPWETEYRGVVIQCQPERAADGSYTPRCVVSDRRTGTPRESAVPLPESRSYASEHDAAHSVVEHAKRWVDLTPGWAGT